MQLLSVKQALRKLDEPLQALCQRYFIHPNVITIARMVLVPFIIGLYWINFQTLAFGLFVFAWILDLFDGPMARAHNVESELGAFLDPLADKLLFISVLTVFAMCGHVWMPTYILLASGEAALITIRFWKTYKIQKQKNSDTTLKASIAGKIKSNLELSAVGFLLLAAPSSWSIALANVILIPALYFCFRSFLSQVTNRN